MLKKDITYVGFDGQTHTDTFYFNLTKAELAEKELVYPGGFSAHLQRIVDTNDRPAIIRAYKDLILSSVGIRTEDGKGFSKQKGQVAEAFEETEAFSVLFIELLSDPVKSSEFFSGVMPADLAEKVRTQIEQSVETAKVFDGIVGTIEGNNVPAELEKKSIGQYSIAELEALPRDEFDKLLKSVKAGSLTKEVLVLAMQRRNEDR